MKSIFYILVTFFVIGCTDDHRTISTLIKAGYSDIHTTGYAPFSCAEEDTYKTGFRAKNHKGQSVEGTVCCGVVKGCTIRF